MSSSPIDSSGADKVRAAEGTPPKIAKDLWPLIIRYLDEDNWEKMAGVARMFSKFEMGTDAKWQEFAKARNITDVSNKEDFMKRLAAINKLVLSFFPDSEIKKAIQLIQNPLAQTRFIEGMPQRNIVAPIEAPRESADKDSADAPLNKLIRPSVLRFTREFLQLAGREAEIDLVLEMGFCDSLNMYECGTLIDFAIGLRNPEILRKILEGFKKNRGVSDVVKRGMIVDVITALYSPLHPSYPIANRTDLVKIIFEVFSDLSMEELRLELLKKGDGVNLDEMKKEVSAVKAEIDKQSQADKKSLGSVEDVD